MELGQVVKKLGKWLSKNMPNAFKYTSGANESSVYFTIYYLEYTDPSIDYNNEELDEMVVEINITTYANKIRVNVIERTPEEFTVGHIVYPPDKSADWVNLRGVVIGDILKKIQKRFTDYMFFRYSWSKDQRPWIDGYYR